jgi:hypothetical protein
MKGKFNSGVFKIVFTSILLSTAIMLLKSEGQQIEFLDNGFLINFLGVFLGVAITLITYIYSVINNYVSKYEDKETIRTIAKNLYGEMKDNTMLIFWFLITIIVITFLSSIDIPGITCVDVIGIEKIKVFEWVKLNIVILSLIAIKDTIDTLFALVNMDLKG